MLLIEITPSREAYIEEGDFSIPEAVIQNIKNFFRKDENWETLPTSEGHSTSSFYVYHTEKVYQFTAKRMLVTFCSWGIDLKEEVRKKAPTNSRPIFSLTKITAA